MIKDLCYSKIHSLEGNLPFLVVFGNEIKIREGLGVQVNNIKIRKLQQVNWPYICLGLPEPVRVPKQAKAADRLMIFNIYVHEQGDGMNQAGFLLCTTL